MISLVEDALRLLNKDNYVLRGIPTSEKEFNTMFTKVTGEDSNGVAIESSDTSDFDVTWSEIESALADGGIVAMAELRKQRDELLKETDWLANSDVTMSDAWATYRQSLRNLPSNSPNVSWDGTNLGNVTFPTKPTE